MKTYDLVLVHVDQAQEHIDAKARHEWQIHTISRNGDVITILWQIEKQRPPISRD